MPDLDTWTMADEDFRSFIESLSPATPDADDIDPAYQTLSAERALYRAARELRVLHEMTTDPNNILATAAAHIHFVAGRLAEQTISPADAGDWLTSARIIIQQTTHHPLIWRVRAGDWIDYQFRSRLEERAPHFDAQVIEVGTIVDQPYLLTSAGQFLLSDLRSLRNLTLDGSPDDLD